MPTPSEFAVLLDRFIELYRHAPDSLRAFLEGDDFWSETLEAEERGDENTISAVGMRALLEDREVNALLHQALDRFPPVGSDRHSEEFYSKVVFKNADLDGLAKLLGISREECLPWLIAKIDERNIERAKKPDFHVYFAWDFAAKVDSIVARVSGLEELEYRQILPETARRLLREAHICYLHGFDAAAAIMCGAVIEQTLKDVLDLDWKFKKLLKKAEDRGLLTPEQHGMGDDVRELRNDAVHDLPKFLKRPEEQRANILSNTRTVVGVLLSGTSNREDN